MAIGGRELNGRLLGYRTKMPNTVLQIKWIEAIGYCEKSDLIWDLLL